MIVTRITAKALWGRWRFNYCMMRSEGETEAHEQSVTGDILYTPGGWMLVFIEFDGGQLKAAYSCPYLVDEEEGTVTHILSGGTDIIGTMNGAERTTRLVKIQEDGKHIVLCTLGFIPLGDQMRQVVLEASLVERF